MYMKRFFGKAFFLFALSLPFFTSCLDSDPNSDFTAEKERENLHNYLTNLLKAGYDVDTSALGVYYVKMKEGTGPFPRQGDTISVKYVGYLMDGSVFDHSFNNQTDSCWVYVHKSQEILASWDEMMEMMNKNCKMEFIIPSRLAYGSTGAGIIPPYSPLIFVAVMEDVRVVH